MLLGNGAARREITISDFIALNTKRAPPDGEAFRNSVFRTTLAQGGDDVFFGDAEFGQDGVAGGGEAEAVDANDFVGVFVP